jgi:sulfur transfer protein SufE
MARYKQLLFYASKLQPLAAELHTAENKVEGCVSQVWVYPTLTDGKVYFQADSDSQLTKGLAALLVEGLSGATCGPSLPPPSPPR